MPRFETFCMTCGAAALPECYGQGHVFENLDNAPSDEDRREAAEYARHARVNPVTGWSFYPEGGSPAFDDEQ